MPVYQRRAHIAAPLERVWEFHSDVSGLEVLTPAWMRLDIESVRGPDGNNDPDKLVAGTEIEISMRPFEVGPRQRWTSRILDREAGETTAWFCDDMVGGPFPRRAHTHRLIADGDETIVEDRAKCELPFGPPGDLADVFDDVGFEGMFRARHAETKRLFEEQ